MYPLGPTVTVGSTVVRTVTDGQRTSLWTTTVSATAVCHYPSSGSFSTCNQPWKPLTQADNKRAVAATAAIAAVTSTYTQTTYTVTSTVRTTIPATTVTEQGEQHLPPTPEG